MKIISKKTEKAKKTISELTEELHIIERQLRVECKKCDGTGKPLTKNGKPPESGHGDARCSDCKGTGSGETTREYSF